MKLAFTVAALAAVASAQSGGHEVPEPAKFAAPIRLISEGEPLGIDRLFPSPRLYDIDGDGQAELVIGDLFGHVLIAEKPEGAGPAEWGPLEPFMTGERALKFSNW